MPCQQILFCQCQQARGGGVTSRIVCGKGGMMMLGYDPCRSKQDTAAAAPNNTPAAAGTHDRRMLDRSSWMIGLCARAATDSLGG